MKLPPLILHPFSDASAPDTIVEGSQAAMRLGGMIPLDGCARESLELIVLKARYCEFRMMFYLGKDVERWMDQCLETVDPAGSWTDGSFAVLLTEMMPDRVRAKLSSWGVEDHRTIFVRALGIRAIFHDLPEPAALAPRFLRSYCRFADAAFTCRLKCDTVQRPDAGEFTFDLYASAEYSRMLEQEWQRTP
ncbi:MAG TPA: hypothetical protein VN428_24200 [Bryobacteraceae bacterium]|nr:hypothetical protein [Bryobacteraceae bacterium]